jgi:NAD/NADP transhydrogenase beta subunit
MPGHMNVLLAEANVPYEQLVEMDDVNPAMEVVDVAIVIGANDVVNPAAKEDPRARSTACRSSRSTGPAPGRSRAPKR